MLSLFRWVALIEGLTTIALFLIAMPLKYWGDNPLLVPPVGMAHGVAWLAYLLAMGFCIPGNGFSGAQWLRTFVAALFPFGTFLNDGLIRRKIPVAAH
jgi:integral membrane protein